MKDMGNYFVPASFGFLELHVELLSSNICSCRSLQRFISNVDIFKIRKNSYLIIQKSSAEILFATVFQEVVM